MTALGDAVQACREIVAARAALDTCIGRRDAALRRMAEEGTPKARVGAAVRAALEAEGFTPLQITMVGVSDGNVIATLRRR